MVKPRIVCAAIKNRETGQVTCGPRHFHCFWAAQGVYADPTDISFEQGFVTQQNDFVDRKTAWRIAVENDQIMHPEVTGPEGVLFSEHLY